MRLPLSEDMAEQLTKGYLTRVSHRTTMAAPMWSSLPSLEQPPAANASKAHWIGYAVRVHGVKPDDAEAMTKNDLIEKYGQPS
jgi:hypothetical protein